MRADVRIFEKQFSSGIISKSVPLDIHIKGKAGFVIV
jgi:hypothetical protein